MADLSIKTSSPTDTEQLGEQLGRLFRPGDRIYLTGSLGAGKTCLVRGAARGWGAVERPTSPTFTLINEYHRPDGARLYHADCYRLSGTADAISTGLEDALNSDGIMVIEWADRVKELLPADALWIAIEDQGDTRRAFQISATGQRASEILSNLPRWH